MAELRGQFPDFDPTGFANSLPYQREDYRQLLLEPLTTSFRINQPGI